MGHPYGNIIKLLLLTGARLTMITHLSWDEIDWTNKLLVIPASRMKGKAGFEIPITPLMESILRSIKPPVQPPNATRKYYVFGTKGGNGRYPFASVGRAKAELDALSSEDADNWMKNGKPNAWRNHDLRRTARTRWSPIPQVSTDTKEVMLAHTLPGQHKVYNQHDYREEKRQLLTAWERILLDIVNPPVNTNVVSMTPVKPKVAPQRRRSA